MRKWLLSLCMVLALVACKDEKSESAQKNVKPMVKFAALYPLSGDGAQYGQTALEPGGWLYFEINPLYAQPLCDMLRMMSYHDIELNLDQYGKQRMIRAKR